MNLPENVRNRYLATWEFMRGDAEPRSVPSILQLAPNNRCNFHCTYCADHRDGSTIPRTELSDAVMQHSLTLIPRIETLAFHGVSEFFIDKNFFDLVGRCAEARACLSLNTNGSVWTERHEQELRDYPGRLDINFSLDAATAPTFLRIRGWQFDRVVTNIRRYMAALQHRTIPAWTSLSFVIMRTNVGEMEAFVRLAAELGVRSAKFYRLHDYGSLSWQIKARDGSAFDYREECPDHFQQEHDRGVKAAEALARSLGLAVEVPALFGVDVAATGGGA